MNRGRSNGIQADSTNSGFANATMCNFWGSYWTFPMFHIKFKLGATLELKEVRSSSMAVEEVLFHCSRLSETHTHWRGSRSSRCNGSGTTTGISHTEHKKTNQFRANKSSTCTSSTTYCAMETSGENQCSFATTVPSSSSKFFQSTALVAKWSGKGTLTDHLVDTIVVLAHCKSRIIHKRIAFVHKDLECGSIGLKIVR